LIAYLQKLIDEEIPIAQKIGITIVAYNTDEIRLKVPFDGNKNHKNTVFGGSIYSAMALSGWGLLAGNIRAVNSQAEVVLQQADIEYKKPVKHDFEVVCSIRRQEQIDDFLNTLQRGKAKISLTSSITIQDELIVKFAGVYVAFS